MRYLILGVTEARDPHGRPLPLGGPRLRSLLAALARHADRPTAVPAGVLIDDIWPHPDDLPDDAPAALQALVGRLRRTLGRTAVTSHPGGYRLDAAPEDVDLFHFTRLAREGDAALDAGATATAAELLRRALDLWRGPALADLGDSPAAHSAAARLEAARATAHQHRIAADLAEGRARDVLPELRQLAAGRPLDEPLHALLVRALRDAGRPAEALQTYETVRRSIADRLGVAPGPELRALHADLLAADRQPYAQQPGAAGAGTGDSGTGDSGTDDSRAEEGSTDDFRVGGTGAGAGPAPTPPPGNLRARLTSFVGREAELDLLARDLDSSRLVTLTGPGGSGKTRLAERAATAAVHEPAARYPDGAWLAELAPLDDPAAVPGTVLSALGRRATAVYTAATSAATTPVAAPAAVPTPAPAAGPTVGEQPDDATTRLLEHCAQRRLLLVLDNCEHVVDAAAHLAETLLAHCPGLTVLATSREPLGVPGETVRPVEPLQPAPAHRLFADRATAAHPRFQPGTDPEAVAEICRRLDGLPLAIELAAARLRSLTPRQIADRLDDRFRLLTSGSRTVLPRQQTLRGVVDWSWDLLDPPERTVVRRLSVFAGGCTLTAAEDVCADPDDDAADAHAATAPGPQAADPGGRVPRSAVLGILGSLVDKSIVVAQHPPGTAESGTAESDATEPDTAESGRAGQGTGQPGVRFRMLETIHEYAAERAAEHPHDRARTRQRHTAHIRELVDTAEPRLRTHRQLHWLQRLEADLDNIRAVLHRAHATGDTGTLSHLAAAMGWFWWLRNYREEGARWIDHALTLLPDPDDPDGPDDPDAPCADDSAHHIRRQELQLLRFFLVFESSSTNLLDNPRDTRTARRVLDTFRRPRPEAARFPGLLWPFAAFLATGPHTLAEHFDTAVANCRAHTRDPGHSWELAVTLLFRAHNHLDSSGGLTRADADAPEIDAIAQRNGDRWLLSQASGLRAELAAQRGHYAQARTHYAAALDHAQHLGALTEPPFIRVRIAETRYRQGDYAAADALARRAIDEADRLGIADARTYGTYLRALVAWHTGRTAQARTLHDAARHSAALGTPPALFDVGIRALDARITAAEGRALDAVHTARRALRLAVDTGTPETMLAHTLLAAATAALAAGHPRTAVRLADAAHARRGQHPAPAADLSEEHRVRARAAQSVRDRGHRGGTGTSTASTAPTAPTAPTATLTVEEALTVLDGLRHDDPAENCERERRTANGDGEH